VTAVCQSEPVPSGRKSQTREFLDRLVEFAGGDPEFCALTGVLRPNLTAYRNGTKPISWKRLKKATQDVFGEPPAFIPLVEGLDLKEKPHLPGIADGAGLYGLFDSAMRLIYWGKATSLRVEIRQTLKRRVDEVHPWKTGKKLRFRMSPHTCPHTV